MSVNDEHQEYVMGVQAAWCVACTIYGVISVSWGLWLVAALDGFVAILAGLKAVRIYQQHFSQELP